MKYLNLQDFNQSGKELFLHGQDYHHLIRVLRKRKGETLWVRLSSQKELFETEIRKISRNQAQLLVKDEKLIHRPCDLKVHLILPWLKKEALTICLHQAVETGVSSVTLVKTDFSVAKKQGFAHKKSRYVKLMEQAGEQSGNPYLPSLKIKENLEETLLDIPEGFPIFYAHHEKGELETNLSSILRKEGLTSCVLFIGAEGGISQEELILLRKVGGHKVFFPTYTLLAASASLYLISLVQSIYKEVNNVGKLDRR